MPFGATKLISQREIEEKITMQDVLPTVERVFRAHGEGDVVMPAKITLDLRLAGLDGWHNAMPAYIGSMNAAGIKWAGGYESNPKRHGLPYVMALIVVQDPDTGYPLAVMDGRHITNLRTGAAIAVCAKYFAKSTASRVAMIGAGTQARYALEALTHLFDLHAVAVTDINPDAASRYRDDARKNFEIDVTAVSSVEEAVNGADIVVTVTYADEPLVRNAWLDAGVTAISAGSFQEFEDEAVQTMHKIVVDSWEQCAHRGELKRFAEQGLITRASIFGEVGETVAGVKNGRANDEERILVVPIGLGSHDIAIARAVLDNLGAPSESFAFDDHAVTA